jgi:nucleoside-diphosphate-sugar epimerase
VWTFRRTGQTRTSMMSTTKIFSTSQGAMSPTITTIAIAGGAGFIGSELINSLGEGFSVRALSRGSTSNRKSSSAVSWVQCDLFSLNQVRSALLGCDMAIYLVHSMLPASHLTQAHFRDLDYLAADNFARAAKEAGVKQIIYVGGIVPDVKRLSAHLESRREVEAVLESSGVPVVSLRCAMVLGKGSSSLAIVTKLVERLPIMVCPAWTERKSAPVHVGDLVRAIYHYLDHPSVTSNSVDVAGASLVTYRSIIKAVAKQLGKKRMLFSVPIFSPTLSCLWVCLFSGAPSNLVIPLIASLRHDMVPRDTHAPSIPGYEPMSLERALEVSLQRESKRALPYAFKVPTDEWKEQTVRSVQRLSMPKGWSVTDVAEEYLRWLPKKLAPLLRVRSEGDDCAISALGFSNPLLILQLMRSSSHETRIAFSIIGGSLVRADSEGILEFRQTVDKHFVLAGIHDFRPRLPWLIYRWSQAIVHKWVMWGFGGRLKQIDRLPEAQK